MKLSLKSFEKWLEKFVDDNPEIVTKIGLSAPIVIKMIKNGTLKAVMTETLKGIRGGFTVKQAFSNALTSSATTSAIAAGIKVGLIAAASAFAFGTIKEAVNYGNATIQGDDTGWDKIWKFAWNTSIPGATVNQFRAFANWLQSKPSQPTEKQRWVTDPIPATKKEESTDQSEIKSLKEQVMDKLNVSDKGEPNKISIYTGFNYDEEAKKLGLSARPTNPQAENQWKKEVEKQMSNKTKATKVNDKSWYFQGLAAHMLGTTLTWSGIKNAASGHRFVAATCLHVDLTLPTDGDRYLHPQIVSNTNIEWQALRGKNTGAFNYGEEEVFKYDFALMAAIAIYRFTGKLIALSNNHDVEVDHLPQMLYATFYNNIVSNVNTGETTYLDVISNKPNYVTRLNAIGKDINSYALKGRTLISRWNYLADKCIKDYSGKKAVYGFYGLRYVPGLDASGNIKYYNLEEVTIPNLLLHLETQLTYLRTVASGSYPAGVLLKVAGDMIKLLGANSNTFSNVPYFTGTEVYSFEYDPEAFDQIRNAKMLPWGITAAPNYARNVKADVSAAIASNSGAGTVSKTGYFLMADNYIMTSDRKVEFDSKENLQMIQFCCNVEEGASVTRGFSVRITDCGTSLLDHISIAVYSNAGAPVVDNYCSIVSQYNYSNTDQVYIHGLIPTLHGTSTYEYTEWLNDVLQIDFMPRYQIFRVNSSNGKANAWCTDVDNYAFMTPMQFRQLNNVAVYSQTFVFKPEDVKIIGIING